MGHFDFHSIVEKLLNVTHALRLRLKILHALGKITVHDFFSDLQNDRHAHIMKELVSLFFSKESIPEPYTIGHIEFLTHEKHDPPESIELSVNVFFLKLLIARIINNLQDVNYSSAFSINTVIFFIEISQESVLQLTHQITEAEEDIGLEVFCWDDSFVAKLPEAVVEYCENLIHSLNILDSSIKPSVDKQYTGECVWMRLDEVGNLLRR